MNNRKTMTGAAFLTALAFMATLVGYSVGYAQNRPTFPKVTRTLTQALNDIEGREVRMEVVEFPPGAAAPGHRHPGHVFVYVLEGQIVSQLEDSPADIFDVGASFYEPTNGLHAVTRNPSETESAKILVIMIMESEKPSLVFER